MGKLIQFPNIPNVQEKPNSIGMSFQDFLERLDIPKGISTDYHLYKLAWKWDDYSPVTSIEAIPPTYTTLYESASCIFIRPKSTNPDIENEYQTWVAIAEYIDYENETCEMVIAFENELPNEVFEAFTNGELFYSAV